LNFIMTEVRLFVTDAIWNDFTQQFEPLANCLGQLQREAGDVPAESR